MAKPSKATKRLIGMWALGIVALVLGVLFVLNITGVMTFSAGDQIDVPEDEDGNPIVITDLSGCPDTKLTDFKLDITNKANESGGEGVDMSLYIINKETGVIEATITDTTSPSATDLECGASYIAKAVSTSGASGDSSVFKEVIGNAKIVDGNLEFTTAKSTLNLNAKIEQHASLSCKAYDNNQRANMYDSSDSSASDYETDGVTFTSSTSNATASDESLGMDIEFDCKSVQVDTEYNDRGVLVLLEMPTTKWSTPTVYVNGAKIAEITLEGDEKDAYVDYEYAFLIPENIEIKDGGDGMTLRVVNDLKPGVSSVTADVQVDLAPRGAFYSSKAIDVISGVAVNDATSPAQIHTLFDINVDYTA